jgi:type 1 glutamine amidotransferase
MSGATPDGVTTVEMRRESSMANGKPGDHPLTDILVHKIETYGPDADSLIRGISDFSSRHELYDWWNREINGSTDRELVLRKAELRFAELMERSSLSGWQAQNKFQDG